MFLVTGEEMALIDQATTLDCGIPSLALMENAGRQVAEAALVVRGWQEVKKVVIVAGKGNNGGDGFVAARHLANRGLQVKVFLLGRVEEVRGDAGINLHILDKINVPVHTITGERDLHKLRIALVYTELIVDAIFGTGFRGIVRGLGEKAIFLLNNSGKNILAVDIPSGLDSSTGRVGGICVRAQRTISFAFPKVGHYLNKGPDYVGELAIADISIPPDLPVLKSVQRRLITQEEAGRLLPRRARVSHKGTFGHTFIISGAPGMTGAAYLTSEGALTAGAGLVTLGIPASLNIIMEQKLTEVMTKPLPETGAGTLSKESLPPVLELLAKMSVLVLGPGLSQQAETKELVRAIIEKLTIPLVLDADGLNAVAGYEDILAGGKTSCVITPHPGELGRLLNLPVAEVQQDRLQAALEAARRFKVTVVLKGANTVVANPAGKVWVNFTGNPGLATAGSGDVLAGIVGGLISQGLSVDEAAVLGVYLHGRAGDEAARDKGMMALKAGDLLVFLPQVLKELELN